MFRALRILPHLVSIHVRTHLEYRGALVIGWIAQAIGYAGTYAVANVMLTLAGSFIIGFWF